jgi:hypothetical protein
MSIPLSTISFINWLILPYLSLHSPLKESIYNPVSTDWVKGDHPAERFFGEWSGYYTFGRISASL